MRLLVQDADDMVEVNVDSEAGTILKVKQALAASASFQLPVHAYRLLYQGVPLNDASTIKECKLPRDAILLVDEHAEDASGSAAMPARSDPQSSAEAGRKRSASAAGLDSASDSAAAGAGSSSSSIPARQPAAAEFFVCQICHETCSHPVTAACGAHNFCKTCLAHWINTDRPAPSCPMCRKRIQRNATDLMVNAQIKEAIEHLTGKAMGPEPEIQDEAGAGNDGHGYDEDDDDDEDDEDDDDEDDEEEFDSWDDDEDGFGEFSDEEDEDDEDDQGDSIHLE